MKTARRAVSLFDTLYSLPNSSWVRDWCLDQAGLRGEEEVWVSGFDVFIGVGHWGNRQAAIHSRDLKEGN